MEGGEKVDVEKAQRQASGLGGEAGEHSGQVSAWCAGTSGRWCRMQRKARALRHKGRPPASDLPLPSGSRGLHPPASPPACSVPTPVSGQAGSDLKRIHVGAGPAHPTPQRADQGRRGDLYLQLCEKNAVRPYEAFRVPGWGKRCCAGDFALARPSRFYCQRLQDRGGKVYPSG